MNGTFTDQFLAGPACPTSPILLCTEGELMGDLVGQYAFDFLSMRPVDGKDPSSVLSIFKGRSHVTTTQGDLFSHDNGSIVINSTGESPFTNHIHFNSGTGFYEGVHGNLFVMGQADLTTGVGGGTYTGVICTWKDD